MGLENVIILNDLVEGDFGRDNLSYLQILREFLVLGLRRDRYLRRSYFGVCERVSF